MRDVIGMIWPDDGVPGGNLFPCKHQKEFTDSLQMILLFVRSFLVAGFGLICRWFGELLCLSTCEGNMFVAPGPAVSLH